MKTIAILGDGDLIFSYTLSTTLQTLLPEFKFKLLCSTYDSKLELLTKYPECKSILTKLSKVSHTSVVHSVDATKCLNGLLTLAEVYAFTDIIFNFPHLAVENAVLHKSLIAHVIYQCKAILSDHGILYITLAEAQAIRWCLSEVVERNDCYIFESIEFNPYTDWGSTYNIKRHHTAQSFVKRVGKCVCYCIKKKLQ